MHQVEPRDPRSATAARVEELEAEVEMLRTEVAALQRRQHRRRRSEPSDVSGAAAQDGSLSRRRLLGLAAGAAAGATGAVLLSGSPAGAADGGALLMGVVTNSCASTTAWTTSAAPLDRPEAITINATGGSFAALAIGNTNSEGWGLIVNTASNEHLQLSPGGTAGPINTTTAGFFGCDSNGVLWLSQGADTNNSSHAVVQKLAPLVPLAAPVRVYDSRVGQPNQAPNSQGSLPFTLAPPNANARVINCQKKASDGTIIVPTGAHGARTLAMNLTVVNTVGVGALLVYANGATQPVASHINWSGTGQVLANGVTSACDASQQVNVAVVASSGAQTDFILDVIGYYS
jgi:hypothetical protein